MTTQPDLPQPADPDEEPQVFAVSHNEEGTTLTRRDFLVAAGAVTAAGVLTGCNSASIVAPTASPTTIPTVTPTTTPTLGPSSIPTYSPEQVSKACEAVRGYISVAYSLAISPDAKLLISGGGDGVAGRDSTIKLWSLPDGTLIKSLKGDRYEVSCLVISPNGKLLVSGGRGNPKLWSLPDGILISTIGKIKNFDDVKCLAISPDSNLLASGSSDETIQLRSLPSGKHLKSLTKLVGAAKALAISADGKLLVSVSAHIQFWSLPDGKLLRTLEAIIGDVVTISADGSLLASKRFDGNIQLWSLPDGVLLKTLEKTNLAVFAISADGKLLISGDRAGSIKLWSLPDGALLKTLEDINGVFALAISADGKLLVSGGDAGSIKLWSLPNIAQVGCAMDLAATQGEVNASTYDTKDTSGSVVSYTIPCGSPIPAGGVCTCNCVGLSGTGCWCVGHTSSGGGGHYWHPN